MTTHADSPLIVFHIDMNYASLRPDYLRHWLAKIAHMGYNAVLWELENKVQWQTCPECVWPEAMGQIEFRALLDYSRAIGLEPIPLLQTVGHAEYVLQSPTYYGLREMPEQHDCYCTSNLAVREFLKQWVQEYLALFGPIRFFHLGGDEAWGFGQCQKCQARLAESSPNALFSEHLNDVAQPLLANNIRPCVWGDMLLHYPADINRLPSEFVIWDWNYSDGCFPPEKTRIWNCEKSFTKPEILAANLHKLIPELLDSQGELRPFYTADMLVHAGREVVLCSASRCNGDSFFVPDHSARADNVAGAAVHARELGLLGTCVTSWAIRQNTYETQERLLAIAPAVMKAGETPVDVLLEQLIPSVLRTAVGRIATIEPMVRKLSAVQWNGLKDSLPAPPGHAASMIAKWQKQMDPFWSQRGERLAAALQTIETGLQGLPLELTHETAVFTAAWREAGELHRRYYQALQWLLGQPSMPAAAAEVLKFLKQDVIYYLLDAQTPLSANTNADLIFNPLLELAVQINSVDDRIAFALLDDASLASERGRHFSVEDSTISLNAESALNR